MSPGTGAPATVAAVKPSVDSSASTRRRRPAGRTRWIFSSAPWAAALSVSSPSRRAARRPEHHDHRFVVAQHQRRQPEARAHPVAAADSALPLDRNPELLQHRDVAPDRSRIDAQPVGELSSGHDRPGLENLEEGEESRGRRAHADSQAQIEGGNSPIYRIASPEPTRPGGRDDERGGAREGRGAGLRFLDGSWKVRNRMLRERLKGRTTGSTSRRRASPARSRRARERGRVPHRLRGRVHRDVVPLLRPDDREVGDLLGRQPRPGLLDPPVVGAFSGDTGLFEGSDTFEGRPILVRFVWSGVTTQTPRWEQAFSDDGGETWETNWVMEFTREDE